MQVIRLAAIILTISFVGVAAAVGSAWNELNEPVPNSAAGKVINIPMGDTADQVVALLQQNGIIKVGWPLRVYMKVQGRGNSIKAGDYTFDSPISPLDALNKLESGEQTANKLTIVEGWNRWDIADAMLKIPVLKLHSSNQVLQLIGDTRSIQDIDKEAPSLEGYIFPETYFVLSSSKPADIIGEAVSLFKKNWKNELEPLAKVQGATAHAIVIVASIIETEAKLKEERPIIASVIYNRLARKMPLGMDSTVVYASKVAGKWRDDGKVYQSDIDRNSPYNTRKITGLPIAPVANPGLSSLRAALQPAKTDYIYYVRNPARNDGAHNFYNNEAQFEQGVQALRDWEKQRDAQIVGATHRQPTIKPVAAGATTPAATIQSSTTTQPSATTQPSGMQLPAAVPETAPAPTPPRAPTASQSAAKSTSPHGQLKPQAQNQHPATNSQKHSNTKQHSTTAHTQSKAHGHKHSTGHH